MSAFAAVLFFSLSRALLAGYGGAWFFPVVLGEALNASLAFLFIAVADWTLRRFGRMTPAQTVAVMRTVEYVALFAYFGKGWVEPHDTLASLIGVDSRLSLALAAVGGVVGVAAARAERRLGPALSEAVLWTVAGWLVLGPWAYMLFDDLQQSRRTAAALMVTLSSLAVGTLIAGFAALAGVRSLRFGFAAAVTAAVAAALAMPGPAGVKDAQSVVLVVVDSLRVDSLERRGPGGDYLMPRLRELAGRGVSFTTAVSPSPWSLPSTVSILSGLNPYRHAVGRIRRDEALPGDRAWAYLGPYLRGHGYQAAGFVNSPHLRPAYGFGDGYLLYRRYHGDAHDGTALALSWIARHRVRPFFVLVQLMDPHWPYEAPVRFDLERDDCGRCDSLEILEVGEVPDRVKLEVRRRYDAEVAFTDAEIGRLYDELERRGILDRTWFVVTADHGEEFWEHERFTHGLSVYDEVLRVPLVVVPPVGMHESRRGVTVGDQVRLEDIAPTLIGIVGLDRRPPRDLDGETLLPLIEDGTDPSSGRPAVVGYLRTEDDGTWAVRDDRYKLIVRGELDGGQLFDLHSDPRETRDLADRDRATVSRLRSVHQTLNEPATRDPAID